MSGKKNGLLRKRLAAWKAHTRNSARTSLPVLIARGSSMAARYSTAQWPKPEHSSVTVISPTTKAGGLA